MRAAPFAAFIFFLAAFPQWPLLRGAAAAVLLAVCWRHYRELRGGWLPARQLALAIGVGAAIFVAWILLDQDWARLGDARDGFDPTRGGAFDWPGTLGRFLVLAAGVPVMEELFWRSFLMRWIDARDFLDRDARGTTRMALALSSALFAMEHSLWIAGLIAGLAYGWLYLRTNNLWAPVVAHTVTNAILGVWIVATGNWHLW